MTELRISDSLALSIDFVTKTCAILAQRRKGKTYTAAVFAEELVAARIPWVALDPTGAWWGLLAAANGVDPGLPVVVFGGQRGQLPLEPDSGKFIADLVLDRPGYYVLDLSLLGTREAERRFAYAFADRLYRRKMHAGMDFPLHLFVDEADMFVPQEKDAGENLMLGAFQAIVRRGGLHGLGTTLISQRPALVNKNVLTQLDMLILLRLVAGNDQDYLDKNYVKRAGTAEQRAELMGSMASLGLGEAWVWEPGSEPPLFERVQIRARHTFNSSATPKAGETRVEPARLADVDLAAIKEAMADTIERAKADDPKELRKQIADLQRHKCAPTEPERVAVPVWTDADREFLTAAVVHLSNLRQEMAQGLTRVESMMLIARDLAATGAASPTPVTGRPSGPPQPTRPARQARTEVAPARPAAPTPAPVGERRPAGDGPSNIGKGERLVLNTVAQYPAGATREQLTILTGYKRSSRDTYIQRLRAAELVAVNGPLIVVTDAGMTELGDDFTPLPTGDALRAHWLNTLPAGEAAVLDVLIAAYPDAVARDEISAQTGYKRSSRDTYLQRLRARQLITTTGDPRAADVLFERG